MTYAIIFDTPPLEASASHLARHGAQLRQERAREARRAFHRAMREKCGLPALKVFG